jgi:hydroxymethylglutaryl-CoA lyase
MNLPTSISIAEVGPRDGLQNLVDFIPTEKKITLIEKLIDSGIKEIELTSFVHPKAIPQLADAADVASYIIKKYGNDSYIFKALVPNVKGAEAALKCGLDKACVVISASESHNKANINRTIKESLEGLKDIITSFPELNVRLDIAMSFGCPFEGKVPAKNVLSLIESGRKLGIKQFVLCDTIGIADPVQVEALIGLVRREFEDIALALHLHDTRGMGLANILTGMQCGITAFETSIGGLGGCPFAPGAAGNTATEDVLNMVSSMGIETSLDMDKLYEAIYFVRGNIKSNLSSHMAKVNRNNNCAS